MIFISKNGKRQTIVYIICLFQLWLTNGYAYASKDGCLVPYENIYLLDEEDKLLLGVPQPYNMAMRLIGTSMLNASDFEYKVEFLSHVPDGELLSYEQCGNILIVNKKKYLLSEAQYELINRIHEFNSSPEEEKTTDFNLRNFGEIKALAEQAGCELDSYLANENVYVPERIKIEVGRDEDGFTIDPAIDIDENKKFQQYFDRMRKVQGQYPIQRENGDVFALYSMKSKRKIYDILKVKAEDTKQQRRNSKNYRRTY